MKTIIKVLTVLLLIGAVFGTFDMASVSDNAEGPVVSEGFHLMPSLGVVSSVSADPCPNGSGGC